MAEAARAELKRVFKKITKEQEFDDPEILAKLFEITLVTSITPADLGNKWESYSLNTRVPIKPTLGTLKGFQKEVEEKHKGIVVKKEKEPVVYEKSSLPKLSGLGLSNDLLAGYGAPASSLQAFQEARKRKQDEAEQLDRKRKMEAAASSPLKNDATLPPGTPSPHKSAAGSRYLSRTNAGKGVVLLNEAISTAVPSKRANVEVLLKIQYERFMNNKLDLVASAHESRLKRLGADALAQNNVTKEGLLEQPSQEPIISFGRVCAEVDHNVTPDSLLLEGVFQGIKPRQPFDVSDLDSYSLFPGQILGVKVVNNGKRFIASNIYYPVPPPHRPPQPSTDAASLLVAAGPFTTVDDLSFSPLSDLLKAVRQTRPSVLILLGPFVDSDHPLIKNPATLDVSFEDLFVQQLRRVINETRDLEGITVFVVPSLHDVNHLYPFPQPPFSIADQPQHLRTLSNPSVISVNGVTIGISSLDVFSYLVTEEKYKQGPSARLAQDRFARFCEHLMQQRSYLPLSPPPLGVPVDAVHMKDAEMEFTPDILIIPSLRDAFAKVVNDSVCINPGRLAKEHVGGTYAHIVLQPSTDSSVTGTPKALAERTRVEIIHV